MEKSKVVNTEHNVPNTWEHRFKDNPMEEKMLKEFDKSIEGISSRAELSGIIFGWKDSRYIFPKEYLSNRELGICRNLIQWIGSPVGQNFLNRCGFKLIDESKDVEN